MKRLPLDKRKIGKNIGQFMKESEMGLKCEGVIR